MNVMHTEEGSELVVGVKVCVVNEKKCECFHTSTQTEAFLKLLPACIYCIFICTVI